MNPFKDEPSAKDGRTVTRFRIAGLIWCALRSAVMRRVSRGFMPTPRPVHSEWPRLTVPPSS
jgi:hypothetical protein